MRTPHSPTVVQRFWRSVQKGSDADCWTWVAGADRKGYGRIFAGDSARSVQVHRLSWEIHFGPIPAGLLVCHRCDNPPCVNPSHLFLGTNTDNIRDARDKGLLRAQRTTHCPAGHAYDPENTYRNPHGRRVCRACMRAKREEWLARNQDWKVAYDARTADHRRAYKHAWYVANKDRQNEARRRRALCVTDTMRAPSATEETGTRPRVSAGGARREGVQ